MFKFIDRRNLLAALLTLLLLLYLGRSAALDTPPGKAGNSQQHLTAEFSGVVIDAQGPVPGATVRIQTTPHATTADGQGRFRLVAVVAGEGPFPLTACARGYYCAGPVMSPPGAKAIELELKAHHTEDNPDYAWIPALAREGHEDAFACARCHSSAGTGFKDSLAVDEWLLDAHSRSARNPRFLTMYLGTDIAGRRSPLTRYAEDPEYGQVALRPDFSAPYYGPGYKLDFPHSAGNCANCHVPMAAVDAPFTTDPALVEGVGMDGVGCDLCHKVWDVAVQAQTGLPGANMPGVLSMEFRRPPAGHQFFAGPFDDVAPGEDTYSPLQRESRLCAACHTGVFWNTLVYNSYGEWLASDYSDPDTGRTCQDCHMPRSGTRFIALPDKGGLQREPETIFGHRMPGASDQALLQNSVSMRVQASFIESGVEVRVAVTNDKTGHHVPTGSPLRHLILLVKVLDHQGHALPQTGGSRIPAWGGQGDPLDGYYAGLPGKAYAKILEEEWTAIAPTAAYWNPTRLVNDNRLAAHETDKSTYVFANPRGGDVRAEVKLIYRRAFKLLMDQKGWDDPDIVMEHASIRLIDSER